jgi:hypothetical protein
MGHSNKDTAQYYVSDFVALDGQSIAHGFKERLHLYRDSSSMMASRNLFAPRPPGSTLTEVSHKTAETPTASEKDVRVVPTIVLSAAQEYGLRRQSRQRAYQKTRQDYLEGKGKAVREIAANNPSQSREPSRYLTALLRFEPHRKAAIELISRVGLPRLLLECMSWAVQLWMVRTDARI